MTKQRHRQAPAPVEVYSRPRLPNPDYLAWCCRSIACQLVPDRWGGFVSPKTFVSLAEQRCLSLTDPVRVGRHDDDWHREHMFAALMLLVELGIVERYVVPAELADHPRPHPDLGPRERWTEDLWQAPGTVHRRPLLSAEDQRAHDAAERERARQERETIDTFNRDFPIGTPIEWQHVSTHTWRKVPCERFFDKQHGEWRSHRWQWCEREQPEVTTKHGEIKGRAEVYPGFGVQVSVQLPSTRSGQAGTSELVDIALLRKVP